MKKLLILLLFALMTAPLWAQVGLEPGKSYLVADFGEDELSIMLDLCRQGGFGSLLQSRPFATYGHYQWNAAFAPEGDASVARMVQEADRQGVQLGILAYQDAISLNDPYFSPRYYRHLLRQGRVVLFDDLLDGQRDFALRASEVMDAPSTLNLLLIDDEMVSYGTMEPARELLLLHRCHRGAYGTQARPHASTAEVYKIWDSPQRFVAPDEVLRDSVRAHLREHIVATGIPFVRYGGEPGQQVLEESVRVRQVERWAQNPATVQDGGLGWFVIHPSDKKHTATTLEEVEWMLSKVAAFDAGCGWVVNPKTAITHGALPEMLLKINQWERLRQAGTFTERQRRLLQDPYLDWHLEALDDSTFQLFPLNLSRRYRCSFAEIDSALFSSDSMEWSAERDGRFGLRLLVEGKKEVSNPRVNTAKGMILFPCTLKPGQQLVYDFDEVAQVVDADWNVVAELVPEGLPILPEGRSMTTLIIEADPDGPQPVVSLRYLTRGPAETFYVKGQHLGGKVELPETKEELPETKEELPETKEELPSNEGEPPTNPH